MNTFLRFFSVILGALTVLSPAAPALATHPVSPPSVTVANGDYLLSYVNKHRTLPSSYAPSDLHELGPIGAFGEYLRGDAGHMLVRMVRDMRSAGLSVGIGSSYRSYRTQAQLFERYSRNYDNPASFSAPPGHSQHQLGTTVDFIIPGRSDLNYTKSFGDTAVANWLREHAWSYGFALSYPQNARHITGYQYEPWHYRYIGQDAAREWHDSKLVLDQYLETKPQYYTRASLVGETVRKLGTPDVYIIAGNGTIRYIKAAAILHSYNIKDHQIVELTEARISRFPNTQLIQAQGDPKVYKLTADLAKRHITSPQVLFDQGYDWSDVVPVSQTELEHYPTGEPIT